MTQRETGEGNPRSYELSDCDSPILVTARAKNEHIPPGEAVYLGQITAEDTGVLDAGVVLHPPGETRVCSGFVTYPHPGGNLPELPYLNALADLQRDYRVKKIDDVLSIISSTRSIDDLSFIRLLNEITPASQGRPLQKGRARIEIFSTRKDQDNGLFLYPYGELDIDEIVMSIGRIVGRIANSVHTFYASDYPANLDINLPGSALGLPVKQELVVVKTKVDQQPLSGQENYLQFEDFGGLNNEVSQLRDFASDVWQPNELFGQYQLERPGAVVLQGPGGVGKTAMIKALARENRAEYMEIAVSDITSKWAGTPVQKLRNIFNRAGKIEGPVIVAINEFDGLFSQNASGNSGVATALVSELKIIMEQKDHYPNVLLALTANSVDNIDSALLRPGRIDLVLAIERPDLASRATIFGKYLLAREEHFQLTKADIPDDIIDHIYDREPTKEIDSTRLAELSEDWTGARIKQVIDDVMRDRMRRHRDSGKRPPATTQAELERAIEWRRHHGISEI